MDKTTGVSAWVMSGIFDLYFAFSIEDISFNKQIIFYNTMGLEKILKGYFILKYSSEYTNLNHDDAKRKIEEIAKSCGHKYHKMIKEIKMDSELSADIKAVLSKSYMRIENNSSNGNKFLKALEKIYMESRYPSATPVSRSFYVKNFFEVDPINTSALIDLIYDISLLMLKYLRRKINFQPKIIKIESYHSKVDSWKRFKRVFFKETNGDAIKYFDT